MTRITTEDEFLEAHAEHITLVLDEYEAIVQGDHARALDLASRSNALDVEIKAFLAALALKIALTPENPES